MRILLIKTSSLGDVIHNLPVVTDLRTRFPEAAIDWVVEEGFAEIPDWHPAREMQDTFFIKDKIARLPDKKIVNEIKAAHEGKIKGNFEKHYLPTEISLKLKVNSQIMLVNNDSNGRWVNGTVGKIIGIEKDAKENRRR